MHVLVIEDAVEIANLIALVLREQANEVSVCVGDFEDVLGQTNWDQIDVVISDRHLDTYDGCLILDGLAESHPEIGRILLTGDTSMALDECNADLVLSKPISADRLNAAIETVGNARK